jgi:transposase
LRRFHSARAYAAYTGLTPRLYQSGQLPERASISRMGPSALRAAFWMAALSASRVEPYASLVARLSGKPKKLAITAVANRLARAAWAVVVKGGLDKWEL